MGTIVTRKDGKGRMRYRAQIRIKRHGRVVYSESRTFSKKAIASDWIRSREEELSRPGMLERVQHRGVTLRELINRYRSEVSKIAPFGRSKDAHLKFLLAQDIADKDALELKASDLVEHVRQRRLGGTGASTVLNDIAWIRVVFKYARRAWGVPLDVQQVEDAAETAKEARLTARPRRRTRRPTADELERLTAYFGGRRSSYQMDLIMWLAIYSTRREGELCRILRDDLDKEHGTYLIRDLKHPDGARGNHRDAVLPDQGWVLVEHILEQVASEDGRLLPFDAKTVGAYFTQACRLLGIDDLRFHDLRHEGISRLAEDGLGIPELQQVSLHESWSSLSIYVNMAKGKRPRRAEWSEGTRRCVPKG